MKRFLSFFKGYKKEAILAPFFKLLEALNELLVPLIVAKIIDKGIAYENVGYVVKMCCVLVVFGITGLGCAVVAQYFAGKGSTGYACNVRSALMKKVQTFSFSTLDKKGASSIINVMTEDVNTIQNGVNLVLRLLSRSPIVVFGAVIFALGVDFKTSTVFLVMLPVLIIAVFFIMFSGVKKFAQTRNSADKVLLDARENLYGVREVRAFSLKDSQEKTFNEHNEKLNGKSIKSSNFVSFLNPLTFAIVNVGIIALINAGALRVYHGNLSQGLVVALYNYMTQILVELVKMANLTVNVSKMVASFQRVESVLDTDDVSNVIFSNQDKKLPYISFKGVDFSYAGSGKNVLKNINLDIEKREKIGIIGSTGSGKSTLVNLLLKGYNVENGKLFFDGKDINSYSDEEIRSLIAFVPQKAVLFEGSVRDNLKWGYLNATDSDIKQALKDADAYDFVFDKNGLDTFVEEGGKNFSGGQRQRLTIARALVKKAPLLILDDSFSALDFQTEAKLIKNIEKYDCTVIIISQRISSFKGVDKIIVMEKGEISSQGTGEYLEENSEIYREISACQKRRV